MAELVYCPTCEGKISINCSTCIHCGETEFFGWRETGVVLQDKKPYTSCRSCKGRKFFGTDARECSRCDGTGKERNPGYLTTSRETVRVDLRKKV
ncbi:hypothetical protein [Rheinheimera sp.]|uniref:hypothetical protein n=1 Tax=Rheinheimera sp. TaxID=1869214 RepID=UPI003D28060F